MPKHLVKTAVALFVVLVVCVPASRPAKGRPAADSQNGEEITIYRDEFGIPNIYAKTDEGAVYGMGYAQAEDRLEELLKQYRRAEGTMSEAFGPEFIKEDYRQRVWQHRAISEANYSKLSAKSRSIIEAYQAGIRQYMKDHPNEVPAWAPELQPWQVVALSRYIIWGWPEGDAGGDLRRIKIEPDPVSARGSNQWVIAANRTVDGVPIALIDPHLSWYGQFRFYEARLYGGELQMAGMAIPGLPLSSLGHNRYCSVAMTTGGPDAADVYEEELNPANPRQYKHDGAWREMTIRPETIRVKEGDKIVEKHFEIEYTHHGPVVAHRNGKGYAMKLPYFDQFQMPEQSYAMSTAHNLAEMKKALSMFQLMEQNIMVATVDGDIFYLRNARIPIRPKGYDWSRPVPGNTSASEWLGIHPLEDLVQLENPWQGYMQNCNVSPEFITKFCPLVPEKYAERPYLFNGFDEREGKRRDSPLHQRAAMTLNELHNAGKVTIRQAKGFAMSTQVYNADLWQARLAAAWEKDKSKGDPKAAQLCNEILRWNRRSDADSTGAVAYFYWKKQLTEKVLPKVLGEMTLLNDRAGRTPVAGVTDKHLIKAIVEGAKELEKRWGRLDVKYGEVFRVGRLNSGRNWPVAGGSVPGMATPRAIGFQPDKDGKVYLGRGGQTSTQVVQLTKPPRSWTLLPLGESDHPESKHYEDQAEKLFSPGKLKPTYFLNKEELLKHVESKTVLHRPAD